jgi:hypothetical protein
MTFVSPQSSYSRNRRPRLPNENKLSCGEQVRVAAG